MKSTESLVQLVQAGKLEPFGELVERYEHAAIAVALPIVGDFHHAQDVAQECFVSAFKSLGSLREPQAFGPWLLTSVRRRARRFASGKQPIQLGHDLDVALANPERSNKSLIANGDQAQWSDELCELLPYLSKLPDHELEVINLRYFAGHSVSEISTLLSRPIGTVTKQLSRGIKRLQQLITEPQS